MAKTKDKATPSAPARIKPPGVFVTKDGDKTTAAQRFGSARLRSVLNLSRDVGIEQVCDDAASRIEELAGGKADDEVHPPSQYRP